MWKITDEWMDKEIKAKGISMEKRRDFAWDLITEHVAKPFLVSPDVIEKRMEKERVKMRHSATRKDVTRTADINGNVFDRV